MTHTLSFSKKIIFSSLIEQRKTHDQLFKKIDSGSVFAQLPLEGSLTEEQARYLVYYDFYQRFQTYYIPSSITLKPRRITLQRDIVEQHLIGYEEDILLLQKEFDMLSIISEIKSLYDKDFIQHVEHVNNKLIEDRRIGMRSDIAYYDIADGRMIPLHHTKTKIIDEEIIVVRLFVDANRDTISVELDNIYDIFGAVALAVNAHDKRYKRYHNKEIILPITNRTIPIIVDDRFSIEGFGTRLIVPSHNRDDFQFAVQMSLPLDYYALDTIGQFTKYAGDFSGKLFDKFSKNVIKFLDDIANLESRYVAKKTIIVDKYSGIRLYPFLEKNISIAIGQQDFLSTKIIQHENLIQRGNTEQFWQDFSKEEEFCISNDNKLQPLIIMDSNVDDNIHGQNILQDIIFFYYRWGLLQLPSPADKIIEIFLLNYHGVYFCKLFFDFCIQKYPYLDQEKEEVKTILESLIDGNINDKIIDIILSSIDLGGLFIYTKQGYVIQQTNEHHYDYEYMAINSLSYSIPNNVVAVYNSSDTTFLKYFLYLSYFFSRESLNLQIYALEDNNTFSHKWSEWTYLKGDVTRIMLLQSCHHKEHEQLESTYTADEYDYFLGKRWNLGRVIQQYIPSMNFVSIREEIINKISELDDYDKYLLSTIHDIYEEVQFCVTKHMTDKIVYFVINSLWEKLSDILLYIATRNGSNITSFVVSYVYLYATHLLYPLAPTITIGLLNNLKIEYQHDFFQKNFGFTFENNIKCNFLLQFLTQWYMEIKKGLPIKGFILQANRDFIEYAEHILPNFYDFLGRQYTIELIDDYQQWPVGVESNKVFAMQWGIVLDKEKDIHEEITQDIQSEIPLSLLTKQLAYHEQLLQSAKNTFINRRSTYDNQRIIQMKNDIEQLEQKIIDIKYQISKVKYF